MNDSLLSFPGNAFNDIPVSLYAKILNRYHTPFYLIYEQSLQKRLSWLKKQFENVLLYFPFKSNSVTWMRAKILSHGFNADIASRLELLNWLDIVKEKAFPIFNMPAYGIEELRLAINHGFFIVINDLQDFEMLSYVSENSNKQTQFLVRVGVSASRQSWSRFGAPLNQLYSFVDKLSTNTNNKSLLFKGFHFHLGTNISSLASYVNIFKGILEVAQDIEKNKNIPISVFDIGGGFGTPVSLFGKVKETAPLVYPKELISELISLIRRMGSPHNKEIWAEPGRLSAEESSVLITRVRKVCREKGILFAVVDGGINLVPTAGYIFHPVKCISNEYKEKTEWVVFGSSCMEKDILSANANLPVNLKCGDVLVIGGVGAYDMAMAYPFSTRIPPKVVCTRDNEFITLNENPKPYNEANP